MYLEKFLKLIIMLCPSFSKCSTAKYLQSFVDMHIEWVLCYKKAKNIQILQSKSKIWFAYV